jgi:superfamily II DNA or RNA helicase
VKSKPQPRSFGPTQRCVSRGPSSLASSASGSRQKPSIPDVYAAPQKPYLQAIVMVPSDLNQLIFEPNDALGSPSPQPKNSPSFKPTVLPVGLLSGLKQVFQKPGKSSYGSVGSREQNVLLADVPSEWVSAECRQVCDRLGYWFSDGTFVGCASLFLHPYVAYVPKKLLALKSNIRPGLKENIWVHLFDGLTELQKMEFREMELALVALLLNIALFSDETEHEHPIGLWVVHPHLKTGFFIDSVRLQNQQDSVWMLEASNEGFHPQGSVMLKMLPQGGDFGQRMVFPKFQIVAQQAGLILIFHSLQDQLLLRNKVFGVNQQEKLMQADMMLLGAHQIQHQLRQFSSILNQKRFCSIALTEPRKIKPVDCAPFCLWFENTGHFQFSVELKDLGFSVRNLPHFGHELLDGLKEGVLTFLDQADVQDMESGKPGREKIQLADRKGSKRERDLKVLKHGSFFSLLLGEMSVELEALLNPQTRNDAVARVRAQFSKKASVLLIEMEKKAGFVHLEQPGKTTDAQNAQNALDKLCSRIVIEIFDKALHRIVDRILTDDTVIWAPQGPLIIEQTNLAVFYLFSRLVTLALSHMSKEELVRPRLMAFAHMVKENKDNKEVRDRVFKERGQVIVALENPVLSASFLQTYSPLHHRLKPSDVFHTLMELTRFGFELRYAGLALEKLKPEDIQSEFVLSERDPNFAAAGLVEQPEVVAESVINDAQIDWFELHPQFFFRGIEMDPGQLRNLSQDGLLEFAGKVYLVEDKNLPNLQRLERFWSKIQGSARLVEKDGAKRMVAQIPRSQTLELLALKAMGVKVQGGPRWAKICQFYEQLNHPRSLETLPATIFADLKPYQKIGVQWLLDLYDLGLGAILADDMGLGKTVQALTFLEILRSRNEMGHVVIVVPTSLTYNWISEADRFVPQMPTLIFQSKLKAKALELLKSQKHLALIVTYGLFTEHEEFFVQHKWNMLVFDEAQNLKNLTAKRTCVSRKIQAFFKLCLTGTPLENHLGEFYSLVDLVVAGSLGDLATFRERYIYPETLNAAEIQFLKLKTKPLVLRRTKAAILSELPPKVESTVKLPFEQKQEKIYRDIALSWNEKVKSSILQKQESKTQILMLTALLRLRQVCSDPGSIPNVKYLQSPPKLTVLLEALSEITEAGESALVFTQFLHTFERVKSSLNDRSIPTYSLHGGTSRPERERILKSFQAFSKGAVLLMTLKTGGVGLNLVKASYVFHLEPWWNPAVENQATDRAHRIGQTRPVQVYRYLMRESVEEKIELLKDRKTAKFNALFSSEEATNLLEPGGVLLSQADFEYLLS